MSIEAKFVVRLDLLIFTSDRLRVAKVWSLTVDYCICKNTHLAAFYQQTKNGFSIYSLLKRSSVKLIKLKSSAFLNPKVHTADKIEMWVLLSRVKHLHYQLPCCLLQLKKSTTWLSYVVYPTK